ncbi:acylneuraminate cytidylyltransferase family protein [Methylomonas sp. LL1]|uniref:acylneuraminate cytidylyltransferase family protein n=1 Tax=Methylomonas sp. LL1 TaxID=2785785 RepID=UPI0018C3BA1D|nr:acylneuraminate cytidylyltransferase family protein [Methylomonas sp. LL1]QPK63130.1 acylneuraminate cytidylyltransferase family protein [Methylomonas sp. LL1]
MKIIAFIPARKGSKRLADKNIKPLAGKPLIAWTIEAALAAGSNMDVIVSTDSPEIEGIAKAYGAEVPFLRPESLAGDNIPTFDALEYTLDRLKKAGREYDTAVLLQPTSPLRKANHIAEALKLLEQPDVRSVVSVSEFEHPVEWTMPLPENRRLDSYISEHEQVLRTRSQDLPKRYRLNGAVYCARTADILQYKSFYMPQGTCAYIMDKVFATDIDDLFDFEYAEFLISKGK